MLICPMYKPIRDRFPLLLEDVVLGSLKFYFIYFFQLDHQLHISLFLTETHALRHSRESTSLKPS